MRDIQAIALQYRIWNLYLNLSVVNLLRWLNSMLSSKPLSLISPFYVVHLTYADYELFFMTFELWQTSKISQLL